MVEFKNSESKERLGDGKIVILGASGLVGSRFLESYEGEFVSPGSSELDITNLDEVEEFIDREKPDVVINFAAYTNVTAAEKSEDEQHKCWDLNVEGVRNILEAIDPSKTRFIQISTDMVFSGSEEDPGPYTEDHLAEIDPDKLTYYGYSKAEAERLVTERLGQNAVILRIIYPVRKVFDNKLDYLRGPLAKYKAGNLHPLFTDQQISITFIDEACEALKRIIEGGHRGIFHAGSRDLTTPHKLISKYISKAEGRMVDLESRPLGDLAGRYPPKGGLDIKKTEEVLGMRFSSTHEIIEKLLD